MLQGDNDSVILCNDFVTIFQLDLIRCTFHCQIGLIVLSCDYPWSVIRASWQAWQVEAGVRGVQTPQTKLDFLQKVRMKKRKLSRLHYISMKSWKVLWISIIFLDFPWFFMNFVQLVWFMHFCPEIVLLRFTQIYWGWKAE